jgi:hypothetical protein
MLRKVQAKEIARRIAHTGRDVGVKQMDLFFATQPAHNEG